MKHFTILTALLLCCLTLAAPAYAFGRGESAVPQGAQKRQMAVDGQTRRYLIQPVGDGARHPVVILLHGGTGTAEKTWGQTDLPALARENKFILVAPEGENNHWNDGRGTTISSQGPSTADDIGFLHALIGQVVKNDNGDARAVFMTGASNGGLMTISYACGKYAGDLRAAAAVIADLPVKTAKDCNMDAKMPWMSVNGTEDPLMPFNGQAEGTVKHGKPQPALMSATETFNFMADRAGCAKEYDWRQLNGGGGDDWAEERRRKGCDGGTQSLQYILHGDGHTWPGMKRGGFILRFLGGSSNDVDAGEIIWDFFSSTLRKP
ncbi:MAG: hypothetical protein GC185_03840 [Alphaproteobacteria bacterium]|nr:hypothetical protein [Alphaproteobacteria bacterium]